MLAEERRVVVKVRIDADSGEPSVISTVVLVYLGRMRFCRNVRPIIVRKGTYIISLSLARSLCLLSLCLYLYLCLFASHYVTQSVCLSVSLSLFSYSVCLSVCLSVSLPLSLPLALPLSLPLYLPPSPSLSLPVFLPSSLPSSHSIPLSPSLSSFRLHLSVVPHLSTLRFCLKVCVCLSISASL